MKGLALVAALGRQYSPCSSQRTLMAETYGGDVVHIPDDLTIGQFILHHRHSTRPSWADAPRPWLVEEETGRQVTSHDVSRTILVLLGLLNWPVSSPSFKSVSMACRTHLVFAGAWVSNIERIYQF